MSLLSHTTDSRTTVVVQLKRLAIPASLRYQGPHQERWDGGHACCRPGLQPARAVALESKPATTQCIERSNLS